MSDTLAPVFAAWGPDFKYHWPEDGDEWTDQARHCGVPYRDWKAALIADFVAPCADAGGVALDLGAGHGRWSVELAPHFGRVLAVDHHLECVAYCRRRFHAMDLPHVAAVRSDGVTLPAPTGSIACVFTYDTAIHFNDLLFVTLLREIARVLAPGGTAVIHHANAAKDFAPGARMKMSVPRLKAVAAALGLDFVRDQDTWGPEGKCNCRLYRDSVAVLRAPAAGGAQPLAAPAFADRFKPLLYAKDSLPASLGVATLIDYAYVKYRVAFRRQPARVVETGVRAGYSGFALCLAGDRPEYTGFDSDFDGNGPEFRDWAMKIIGAVSRSARYVPANTRDLTSLPPAELYHIDADHSYDGALHELGLALAAAPPGAWILVDDYQFIPDVRRAVEQFHVLHPQLKLEIYRSLRGEALFIVPT